MLRDTQEVLATLGDDAPASLTYALRVARAEAREATESNEGARRELEAALRELPSDALYFRVRAAASLARVLADEFDWDGAHDVLNGVGAELANATDQMDREELRRCAAIQKLPKANVHRALGEDAYAAMHYRESAPVLEESGEIGFAVSALQGIVMSAPFLGYLAEEDTSNRLKDLARTSSEQRRCTDLQREGIEYLADDKVAAARNSLIKAEAAANALHSPIRSRSVLGWFADVLLKAGFPAQALLGYAGVGDRDKVKEVLGGLRQEPPRDGDAALPMDRLLRLAKDGPLHARGAALVALQGLWPLSNLYKERLTYGMPKPELLKILCDAVLADPEAEFDDTGEAKRPVVGVLQSVHELAGINHQAVTRDIQRWNQGSGFFGRMLPYPEQFAGSLIGQCLGDALGFVVEGSSPEECREYVEEYLNKGRAGERARAPLGFGQYSDDSQLARELLQSYKECDGRFEPASFAKRIEAIFAEGRIVGPGRSTKEAAHRLAEGVPWDEAGMPPPAAGNGSAMRAGSVGLLFFDEPERMIEVAKDQGRITHQNPRCSAGAVAVAGAVALAATSERIDPAQFLGELAGWVKRVDEPTAVTSVSSWGG